MIGIRQRNAGRLVTALLAMTLATCGPSSSAVSPVSFDPAMALRLDVVVDGLADPVDVAAPGDDSGRLFVVEQAGRIRVVAGGRLAAGVFLDISERITSGGERGLLGLTFHPDFPDDPRLFVNYTDLAGDTVVAEFRLREADMGQADPASERILVQIKQPFPNHNGGGLAFGPDGMLYVATGDGGSGGDPEGNGQRLDTLLGKILRIDLDGPRDAGATPYRIPEDNPFVGVAGAAPEIWATGLRNPWRIRFDSLTGDLWIGDVGQGDWEEIDVARAGERGLNFGWNRMEGSHCFQPRSACDTTGLTPPITEYGHDLGCAVVGGVVVRDPGQPLLDGRYVFGDACTGALWVLDPEGAGPRAARLAAITGRSISSIAEADDGSVVATSVGTGELVTITAEPR